MKVKYLMVILNYIWCRCASVLFFWCSSKLHFHLCGKAVWIRFMYEYDSQISQIKLYEFNSLKTTDLLIIHLQNWSKQDVMYIFDSFQSVVCFWFTKINRLIRVIPYAVRIHWLHFMFLFQFRGTGSQDSFILKSDDTGCAEMFWFT